jgi:hypothetical protein
VTRAANVPQRVAPAQPDAELTPPWPRRKDQVNGSDEVSGTHKRRKALDSVINTCRRAA